MTLNGLFQNADVYGAHHKQESRAIAGITARCRWKFRYVSNFTMAWYVPFPYHSGCGRVVVVDDSLRLFRWLRLRKL